jgi:hypothetical protein
MQDHVKRIGKKRNVFSVTWGNPKETACLECLGVDRRIMSKWILNKYNRNTSNDFVCQLRGKWRVLVDTVT